MKISRKVFDLLKISGWHPGRNIDCTAIIELLIERGFVVNECVISFLNQYGNLEINMLNHYDTSHLHRHHTFVKRCIGILQHDDFVFFEHCFGEKLVPIGELHNRHVTLFLAESGNFYCDFGFLGDSFEMALENILSHQVLKNISAYSYKEQMGFNPATICILADKTRPTAMVDESDDDLKGLQEFHVYGSSYTFNPTIKPNRRFNRFDEFKTFYKFCLTAPGLERYQIDHPEDFEEKNLETLQTELEKLRKAIARVWEDAKARNARSLDGSYSFEIWPIENCAEIWAARKAILKGIKFENISLCVLKTADMGIVSPCNNCMRIFEQNYRVKE